MNRRYWIESCSWRARWRRPPRLRRAGRRAAPPRRLPRHRTDDTREPRKLKNEALADVEAMQDVHAADGRPDLQLRRARASRRSRRNRYLIDILEKNGFTVEEGVAGIPTAFVATWGSGKPVIALGSDIDGIPQASQKPGVAYHEPLIEGAPGHGEGHNSGQAVNITAAIAVKKIMEREKIPGTIRIWPGAAEELVGTKAYFIRAGLFKDVDVALFTHVDRQSRRVVGRPRRHRPGVGAVLASRARPRTRPARRGADAARSTPSS